MDSLAIARALETHQPSPSLRIENGFTDRTQKAVLAVQQALAPLAMPRVPIMLLNGPSAEYFEKTREKRFGMPLAEFAESEKAKNAWSIAEEPIKELRKLMTENEGGPWVEGTEPSFADLILLGFWRFLEELDPSGGDLFGRVVKGNEVFEGHYEAGKGRGWLRKDD
jgi:glutathione S-transferase